MVIKMFYLNNLTWDLIIASIAIAFVLINLVIGTIKYRKIKNNKTVGKHDTLVKLKLNEEVKVNDYDLGIHIYADKEKNKWVLITDVPKSCDVYSFQGLEDYFLTVNGEYVIRSNMKDTISEIKTQVIHNITLDIYCKNKKYRFALLTKECRLNDSVFLKYYNKGVKFSDILDYIIENN